MPNLQRAGKPALHYEVDDFTDPWRKTPLVFLQHGFGRSSRFWYSWIPYLSRFCKVIRPDLRGLGQSSTDLNLDTDLNVSAYVEDIIAIIDANGGGPVHYCGESLGGILGIVLSAEHPEYVSTLSLISAPVYNNENTKKTFAFGHESWEEALRKLGSKGWALAANSATRFPPGTDPGLLEWYAEEMGKSKVEVLIAMQRLAAPINVTPFLSRIKAPVLGLYPSSGLITSQEQEDLLRSNIRNIRIVHSKTSYHTIQNIEPASCALHVLHFVCQNAGISCHE